MSPAGFRFVYGPVPSRRLGRSLGIDLVPFKACTYDCIYCQLGRTTRQTVERREYVPIREIEDELKRKLAGADRPDYLSLAGSGEPTLNSGLGMLISRLKTWTSVPVAVLTNGSLLWQRDVQDALLDADLVLPSLDAGDERMFGFVNRPAAGISFDRMVDGLAEFTGRFSGEVWLEVLLLAGVTGIRSEAEKIAALAKRIGPARIQLNTACRPPAEDFAFALTPDEMSGLKGIFPGRVEIIVAQEAAPASKKLPVRDGDILSLLRRRPCTAEDIAAGLDVHVTEALKQLSVLVAGGKVRPVISNGRRYYIAAGSGNGSGPRMESGNR